MGAASRWICHSGLMAHFIDLPPESLLPTGEGLADVAVGIFGSDSAVIRRPEDDAPTGANPFAGPETVSGPPTVTGPQTDAAPATGSGDAR